MHGEFPGSDMERGKQAEPGGLHALRSLQKPRQLQLTARSTAEERAALTENSEDLQRIPLKLHNGHHMYVKNYMRLEKGPADRVGGNNVRSSPRARNRACFQQ